MLSATVLGALGRSASLQNSSGLGRPLTALVGLLSPFSGTAHLSKNRRPTVSLAFSHNSYSHPHILLASAQPTFRDRSRLSRLSRKRPMTAPRKLAVVNSAQTYFRVYCSKRLRVYRHPEMKFRHPNCHHTFQRPTACTVLARAHPKHIHTLLRFSYRRPRMRACGLRALPLRLCACRQPAVATWRVKT